MKQKYLWLRRLPMLIGIALTLIIIGVIAYLISHSERSPQTKKVAQQITMIQPPPPPPPPEVKPPEPEQEQEKIDDPTPEPEPEPEPTPDESNEPPAEELGLDAEGGAGSDAFGLAARKGGHSLLGGGGGNAIVWYGGQVKQRLEDALQPLLADTAATKSGYSVIIEVWVDNTGQISRTELSAGSGKAEVDQALRTALSRLKIHWDKAPPENMPQPIRMRLTAKL
jgi:periplasmic protein TonB